MGLRSKMSKLFLLTNVVILVVNVTLVFFWFDTNPLLDFFAAETTVTAADRRLMLSTFSVLVDILDKANVTYFMYGGTLIGSVRHHGPIPWDDDLDVIAAYSDRAKIAVALSAAGPDFSLYRPDDSQTRLLQWKFYSSSGSDKSMFQKPYLWPFVDIFFFRWNSTHVWDIEPEYHHGGFLWEKSIVFPLRRRPFGTVMAPAPCNSLEFVASNYPGAERNSCASANYNHRLEVRRLPWRAGNIVPCDHLWEVFPFVFRSLTSDGGITEFLRIGNWTVQTVQMPPVVCTGDSAVGNF